MLLVDDHDLFREGLKSLLQTRGVQIVGEASNGARGIELARHLRPDLILMDLSMPTMGGLEATRLLKAERPEQRIVILTASEDDQNLFEAVKAGAQGYLLKNLDADTFFGLIEAAARGEPALTPPLAAKILGEFARLGQLGRASPPGPAAPSATASPVSPSEPVEPLTAREQEVLELIVDGLSNREIAARLVVTENTVKYHLKNILDKLHLQNRAQVVAFALRHGLTGG